MKLVIFDMDGLMFDTESVAFRAYEKCGKEWGLATSLDIYKTLIAKDKRDTCASYREIYGADMEAELFYTSIGRQINVFIEEEGMPVKPGLYELLDAIDRKGYRKVIASSSEPEVIEDYLAKCNLSGRFDGIVSSKEVEHGKPYPDVFLEACRRQNVAPEDALVLEDAPEGVQAAHAGRIPVIVIPDLKEIPGEIQQLCVMMGKTLLDVIPYISGGDIISE